MKRKNASVITEAFFPVSRVVRRLGVLPAKLVDHPYVFGSRTLRSTAFFVLDFLTFSEAVEVSFNCRMMKEDITSFTFDKTKAYVCQLFDRTLRHLYISHSTPLNRNVVVAVLRT